MSAVSLNIVVVGILGSLAKLWHQLQVGMATLISNCVQLRITQNQTMRLVFQVIRAAGATAMGISTPLAGTVNGGPLGKSAHPRATIGWQAYGPQCHKALVIRVLVLAFVVSGTIDFHF